MTTRQLKAIRRRRRLSQQGLADLLGVSRNTVTRWEMGLHPIPTPIVRLLDYLDRYPEKGDT